MFYITFISVMHFHNHLCISISPKILKEIFALFVCFHFTDFLVSVLLSACVERFCVSRIRDYLRFLDFFHKFFQVFQKFIKDFRSRTTSARSIRLLRLSSSQAAMLQGFFWLCCCCWVKRPANYAGVYFLRSRTRLSIVMQQQSLHLQEFNKTHFTLHTCKTKLFILL